MRQKPDVFLENASHRTLCCVTSPLKPTNSGVSSSKIRVEPAMRCTECVTPFQTRSIYHCSLIVSRSYEE